MSWEQLTLWSEEVLVSPSAQLETEVGSKTQEASLCMTTFEWLEQYAPSGSSGKMYQVSYPWMVGVPLEPCSGKWQTSGIVSAGECLTLNTLESASIDAECSLSEILEPMENVQPKFYLTHTAAAGILARDKRRNKILPSELHLALENIANHTQKLDSHNTNMASEH